jgi:hypothetical protein
VTPRSRASPLVIIKDEYGGCIIIIREPRTPRQAHPAPTRMLLPRQAEGRAT